MCIRDSIEVECSRHPGASTVGSQLLDVGLLPCLANPSNPAMRTHVKSKILSAETTGSVKEGLMAMGSKSPERCPEGTWDQEVGDICTC